MTIKEYVNLHKNKPVINPHDSNKEWFIIGYKEKFGDEIVGTIASILIIGSFDDDAYGWVRENCNENIIFVFPDPIFIKYFWNINTRDIEFK